MADSLVSRIRRGWNAFTDSGLSSGDNHLGYSYGMRQDRGRGTMVGAQTTLGAVRNRISMDAADNEIRHIRVNENRNFVGDIYSSLNECLTKAVQAGCYPVDVRLGRYRHCSGGHCW